MRYIAQYGCFDQPQNFSGAGTNYPVRTVTGAIYRFHIGSGITSDNDLYYTKSVDGGRTWGADVVIRTGTVISVATWYRRWSGVASDTIIIAYTDSGSDDTYIRILDTTNDSLGAERTAFAGGSTAAGGALSVTVSRGNVIYLATCIDAGAEYSTTKTANDGVNWTDTAEVFEGATQDQVILMPGFAADQDDIIAIFWDADADEISRKLYDQSGDSWGETSIATSMVDTPASTAYPNFSAAPDLTNSRVILAAWSAMDTAGADLRFFSVSEGAITEGGVVVTDSTDDQALTSIAIDTAGNIYVFYVGSQDGAESINAALTVARVYYKISANGGTSWGAETQIIPNIFAALNISSPPILYHNIINLSILDFHANGAVGAGYITIPLSTPRTTFQLGL